MERIYKGRVIPYLTVSINYTRTCFYNLNIGPYALLYLTGAFHNDDVGDRKKNVLAFNYSIKQSNAFREKQILDSNIKMHFFI